MAGEGHPAAGGRSGTHGAPRRHPAPPAGRSQPARYLHSTNTGGVSARPLPVPAAATGPLPISSAQPCANTAPVQHRYQTPCTNSAAAQHRYQTPCTNTAAGQHRPVEPVSCDDPALTRDRLMSSWTQPCTTTGRPPTCANTMQTSHRVYRKHSRKRTDITGTAVSAFGTRHCQRA